MNLDFNLIKYFLSGGFFFFIFNKALAASSYVPLVSDLPFSSTGSAGGGLGSFLKQIFNWGIGIAVTLTILMIIFGGVQYMTTDAIFKKEEGKKRITGAVAGLLLSLSGWLILNQINPNILKETNIGLKEESFSGSVDLAGGDSGKIPSYVPGTEGSYGSWEESASENWFKELPNGSRTTDGRLVVTSYWDGDTGTNERRGNANNLLREGSVALSPDLIAKYKPSVGQEIFINGTSIGFYEDTAGKPGQWQNTVDVYDGNRTLGGVLKNIPANQWNLTLGENKRPQISNP
jgi:hypothetical protein